MLRTTILGTVGAAALAAGALPALAQTGTAMTQGELENVTCAQVMTMSADQRQQIALDLAAVRPADGLGGDAAAESATDTAATDAGSAPTVTTGTDTAATGTGAGMTTGADATAGTDTAAAGTGTAATTGTDMAATGTAADTSAGVDATKIPQTAGATAMGAEADGAMALMAACEGDPSLTAMEAMMQMPGADGTTVTN